MVEEKIDNLWSAYETKYGEIPSVSYYNANIRPIEKQNTAKMAMESYCASMGDNVEHGGIKFAADTHTWYYCWLNIK